MMPGDVDPLAVLQKAACFAQVETPLMGELAGQAQVVLYQKGEVVTRMGQHFNHLGVIAHGQIELSVTNRAGKRHVLNVMQSGQIYGLIPMLDGKPLYYGATAISQCTMVTLSRELMVSAMQRSSALMTGVFGVMCARSRDTFAALADQHLLSPPARLARYLVQLASKYGPAGHGANGVFTVDFSQDALSDMLDMSRQSLNRAILRLEALQLIEKQYSKVTLVSIDALQSFVSAEL
jgi:CRP-like cAMP-binding protein